MPKENSGLAVRALAVLAKDIRVEMRSRYAVNAVLLFAVTALVVVSYALGQRGLSPGVLAALFWVVVFFAAMSGLARVFVREEEAQTAMALRLLADPDPVFVGKLLFNLLLLSIVAGVVTPLFLIFTDVDAGNLPLLVLVVILGVVDLCAATTLVAAVVAKASVKSTLFAVLAFPVLIPPLMALVGATEKVFEGRTFGAIAAEVQFLFAYAVVMTVGSVLLFKFVWREEA